MFQPFARLTHVTSQVSNQLFSVDSDAINGSESAYIESVLTKVSERSELVTMACFGRPEQPPPPLAQIDAPGQTRHRVQFIASKDAMRWSYG